jgi:peptidyl-prolyl cis-trans isomerase SurA
MSNPIDMKDILTECRIAFLILLSCSYFSTGFGQTLISYDDQTISKEEFINAYRKNNNTGKPSEKSYRDYLDLYIRYKLKVKAAYDLKLDTLGSQVAELQNFRNQVVEPYMHDEAGLDKLAREAFQRSQKDLHIAHIFVAAPANAMPRDTLKAFNKAMEAYTALQKGGDFGQIAAKYSDDPFVKSNFGDIGYITVFSLPYELEGLAYRTAPGKISRIYRSNAGFHIFKNLGERKGLGKVRIAQILLVYPPNATETKKAVTKQLSDSLFAAILRGGDFAELAKKFSGDNLSYQIGGEIPEFGVGKYEPDFEKAAFGLEKDGDVSKPVPSSFGYHILKRLGRKPVSAEMNKGSLENIKQQVMNDPRIEIATKEMLQNILKLTHFRQNSTLRENDLWVYTDSSLAHKPLPKFPGLSDSTAVFYFGSKSYIVKDWMDYRKAIRNIPSSSGPLKTNQQFFERYRENVAYDYYRNHLENYNKQFAAQLKEFKDGNLLFDIMQRKVWDKASSDAAGLENYYKAHASKYWWAPSASAIVFTFSNEKAAENLTSRIQNNIENWRKVVDSSGNQAQADSGRFELTQLPMAEKGRLEAGQFSSLVKNPADNTITAAYIIRMYNERQPRSYADARGLVINDYQNYLEDNWIAELKKKYPVKINEAVFKSLPK